MTNEEAGQRILEGRPKINCTACGGKYDSDDVYACDEWLDCKVCGLDGLVLDPTYIEACHVLGMLDTVDEWKALGDD